MFCRLLRWMRAPVVTVWICAAVVSPSVAQVFNSGPDDPSRFDTVLNLPPDPDIELGQQIGSAFGSTTQLNLSEGGRIGTVVDAIAGTEVNVRGGVVGSSFDARSGSEVNISGGVVGSNFQAFAGSEVNMSGGRLGGGFDADAGSVVSIRGGSFGRLFEAMPGSDVELIGAAFRLNQNSYNASVITLNDADLFTGTLEDGSVFIFSPLGGDSLSGVTLTAPPVPLPPPDLNPRVLTTAMTDGPSGLRAGQTLTVRDGGVLGEYFGAVGATLNVEGGEIAAGLEVVESVVNITAGSVGLSGAYVGSEVTISGGRVGTFFSAHAGSVVAVSGGEVDSFFEAGAGSDVNITGGRFGTRFTAGDGSVVTIQGGTFGRAFQTNVGSDVELIGGEFRLNGAVYSGSTVTLDLGDVFTGTLADGSVFVFNAYSNDALSGVSLAAPTQALPPADPTPMVLTAPAGADPSGLRAGQTLTVRDGGVLDSDFAVVGATLNIDGGVVGDYLEVSEGVVNISGGSVGTNILALPGSVVNISGGSLGNLFRAFAESELHLHGSEFRIGGESIAGLVPGEPYTITERGEAISGILSDGSSFSFVGQIGGRGASAALHPDATVTVTLVPEPSTVVAALGFLVLLELLLRGLRAVRES